MLRMDKMRELRRLKHADGAPIEKIMRRENIQYGTAREVSRSNPAKFTYPRTAAYPPVTGLILNTLEDIIKGEEFHKTETAAVCV